MSRLALVSIACAAPMAVTAGAAYADGGFNLTTPFNGNGRAHGQGYVNYDGRVVRISGSTNDICPADDFGVSLTLWPYDGGATAGNPIHIKNGDGCQAGANDFNVTLRPYDGRSIQRVQVSICEFKRYADGSTRSRDCVDGGFFRR